jgi:hypothetical protein
MGAGRDAGVSGIGRLTGTANYLIGNDPRKWRTGVPAYAKVKYTAVYPGVDLVYYGNQRNLEYDFVVAPGASAESIRLGFEGAKHIGITGDGALKIASENGEIAFRKPEVYQIAGGKRQAVDGRFELVAHNMARFVIGTYDRSRLLVIDPALDYYSTYLSGSVADAGAAIALNDAGEAYVVGTTDSPDFPVSTGAFQAKNKGTALGASNVFITKLNAAGTALVYSTYLGGSGVTDNIDPPCGDNANGMALDGDGNVYVVGVTCSRDFPVTAHAYQGVNNAPYFKGEGLTSSNAFVTKLNSTGAKLIYSTYLGGSAIVGDYAAGVAIDASGDAFVTGSATSPDFPVTKGAAQTTNNAASFGGVNAFVTEFNPEGSGLVFSTFLGGSRFGSYSNAIALVKSGDVYVAGADYSTDFPVTANAFQKVNKAAKTGSFNAFAARLNPDGSKWLYATLLGGSTGDSAYAIAVDGSGNAYLTGGASSADFPVTAGAFQKTNMAPGGGSGFVTKINSEGSSLVYSTYLGGAGGGTSNAITLDGDDHAYVAGFTLSGDYPATPDALQTGYGGITVSKLDTAGSGLLYSTQFGPYWAESASGIALDREGNIYLTGYADAIDFPVTAGAFQTTLNAANRYGAAYVTKLGIGSGPIFYAAAPVFNPPPLVGNANATVSIADPTGGVTIHYTTDGTTPTKNSKKYTKPISVTPEDFKTQSVTINAMAVSTEYTESAVTSGVFEVALPAPAFSPPGGNYLKSQDVTITAPFPDAIIQYSLNHGYNWSVYKDPIPVSQTETIEACAGTKVYACGWTAFATYNIGKPQTITFAPLPSPLTYGVSPIKLSVSASSGLPVQFTVYGPAEVNASLLKFTGAGSVLVYANQPGNSVYAAAPQVIQDTYLYPATLNVTAQNRTMEQGSSVPELTYSITGFVNGDTTKTATTGEPKLTTTATSSSAPGSYPIKVTAGTLAAENYNFTYVDGTLTVIK